MRKYLAVVALVVLPSALGTAARANTRVYVRVTPPVAIVETHPAGPSPRHVWIAGYHRWDGRAYVWVPGRWEMPPVHRRAWVAGHWSHHRSNGWYWVDGHWR